MTTLRVRLAAPFDATAASAWWRAGEDGRVIDRGVGPPSQWPAGDRVEVAVAAGDVRIATLALPPMNDARRSAAAAFALEDQLAAPSGSSHLRVSAPASPGGPTVARIVDRSTLEWLDSRRPVIGRVVAEPDLVPQDGAWHWCIDGGGRGFVRRSDGSAFAAGPETDAGLPAELTAALAQARRAQGRTPLRIVVDGAVSPERLAAWSQAHGASFVRGTPWSLEQVPTRAWAAAPDLRDGLASTQGRASASVAHRFAPALWLAVAALALHLVGTTGTWVRDRYLAWRADRAVVAIAGDRGIADASDARTAEAALAKRAAAAAHAAGRTAEGDLLPLLARAAPALAALPAGTLRKLTYGDRRLVAELASLDEARVSSLVRELSVAGLAPVAAPAAGGVRIAMTAGS